jgi:hypothetical protein
VVRYRDRLNEDKGGLNVTPRGRKPEGGKLTPRLPP